MVEHVTFNHGVPGSIPGGPTNKIRGFVIASRARRLGGTELGPTLRAPSCCALHSLSLREALDVGVQERSVVFRSEWPSSIWMCRPSNPRSAYRRPHSCRRSCQCRSPSNSSSGSVIFDSLNSVSHAFRKFWTRSPAALPNGKPSAPPTRRLDFRNRSTRADVSGISRSFRDFAFAPLNRQDWNGPSLPVDVVIGDL